MLECIVKNYQIDVRVNFLQFSDADNALFAYCNFYTVAEFLVNLVRFIADVERRTVFGGKDEAFCHTLVSAAEHCDVIMTAKQVDNVFGVRRFAGSTNCEIADADDGDVEFYRFKNL